MADGFSGKIVFDINVNVSGGGSGGGGGGGGPVTPGGGGPARPEGTSPRGGGNKAANPEIMYGFVKDRQRAQQLEREAARADKVRVAEQRAYSGFEDSQKREGNRRAMAEKRQAITAARNADIVSRVSAGNEQVASAIGGDLPGFMENRRRARVASSILKDAGSARSAMAKSAQDAHEASRSGLERAMTRMTDTFKSLFGSADAAQRQSMRGQNMSALGRAFILSGMAHQAFSGIPTQFDPGGQSRIGQRIAIGQGALGAASIGLGTGIGAMAGNPIAGAMLGGAIGQGLNQVIDGIYGPDKRMADSAASGITSEIMARKMAGVPTSSADLKRIARYKVLESEIGEKAKQQGLDAEDAARRDLRNERSKKAHEEWLGQQADRAMGVAPSTAKILQDSLDKSRPSYSDRFLPGASAY